MRSKNFLLACFVFLLGVFSETKVYFYGTLAIAEILVFVIAPIIFAADYKKLSYDGFLPFLFALLLVTFGMLASSWYNKTPLPFLIKQSAVIYSVFAYYVVFHRLLRNNYNLLGVYFVGVAISTIIIIFIFNPQASLSASGSAYIGNAEVDDIVEGPLFWAYRLKSFGSLPFYMMYLKTPIFYVIFAPIAYIAFIMLTTISGRSASISFLLAGALMLVGGKSRRSMAKIGRHLIRYCILGVVLLFSYKILYKVAAQNDLLGEEARTKYETQTKHGDSFLKMLMAGRGEFFVGLMAVCDRPIMGFGPHAIDRNGYWEKFLIKYGDWEDLQYYYGLRAAAGNADSTIPSHSCIIGAWHKYGILGLFFYIYVLWLMIDQVKRYMHFIPQWYGYFSLTISSYVWSIFFSGFSGRHLFALFMVTLFFARAIGHRRLQLPIDMELEARKYE